MLDIDEVIALIRASDDTASARMRLQSVFDLSEIQSAYILEMPLRRLTKFSRIELEKERDELNREVTSLTEILENDSRLRAVVSEELSAVSHKHASPRRTLLLEGSGAAVPTKVSTPLEVADEPCVILLSSTGLIARTPSIGGVQDGARAHHDVIVSAIATTTRSDIGLLTSTGRVIRLAAIDLPSMPTVAGHPALGAGAPLGAFIDLPTKEVPICLLNFDENSTLAIGTSQGVVKRVAMDVPSNKDSWEVIRLDEGDSVVGGCSVAEHEAELLEACFITSDAQLLLFPLASVRPQGRAAGGVAGIKLSRNAQVAYFGLVSPHVPGALVTISGTTAALPGTEPGSLKVTTLSSFPLARMPCLLPGRGPPRHLLPQPLACQPRSVILTNVETVLAAPLLCRSPAWDLVDSQPPRNRLPFREPHTLSIVSTSVLASIIRSCRASRWDRPPSPNLDPRGTTRSLGAQSAA
jgi:DNA gyrase subunit A